MNLKKVIQKVKQECLLPHEGRVHTIKGQVLISKGPICKIGDICKVGREEIPCEVVAIENEKVVLTPYHEIGKLSSGDLVRLSTEEIWLPPVHMLLGKTLNALGESLVEGEEIEQIFSKPIPIERKAPPALKRKMIKEKFITGIKAIDSCLTIGKGQRIGIFAGSGVGKTTLLGMIAKKGEADVNVLALVGERGREVIKYIQEELGEEGLKKSVLIVSTSDEAPLMRIKAAKLATSIAEEFRDQGKNVLLMMDALSRCAEARIEIDFASGQIAPGGKTPSMGPFLRNLLERAGNNEKGTITGIYTVLVDGEDFDEPVPDTIRGILDGHIYLKRELTFLRHYPAIDILSSTSRVMEDVVERQGEHDEYANEIKKNLALYAENIDNFKIGALEEGQIPEIDRAFTLYPKIMDFLKQGREQYFSYEETMRKLGEVFR